MSPADEASQRPSLREPGRADTLVEHALALRDRGEPAASARAARRAALLAPDLAHAYNLLALAQADLGLAEAALASSWRAVLILPGLAKLHSNYLLTLNYLDRDAEEIYRAHLAFDRRHGAPGQQRPQRRRPTGRLRIGYVSGDFRLHPCAYFVSPLLAGHDRSRFETVAFSNVQHPDGITDRVAQLVERWVDISALEDGPAAALIRELGIDILVDLSGHTAFNRLTLFAQRPAPVQASWFGYCNSTGLSAIDFRVTDAVVDPPGDADALHSELLVRLPKGFLCYGPPEHAPAVGALPGAAGRLTLACFNTLAKITPAVLALWTRILQRLPASELWLRGDGDAPARYAATFAQAGVAPDRIRVLPRVSARDNLASYAQVDIALDPFPYNGTTTTCEALWMGVPVVTLAGRRHAARVSASLLRQVGLTTCIANSPSAYVDAVLTLAADLDALARLRAGLRRRMMASPLCDYRDFARRMETAYQWMWEQT